MDPKNVTYSQRKTIKPGAWQPCSGGHLCFFYRGELDGDVHPESFINKDSTYQNVDLAQETGKFEVSNNGDSKNGDLAISMWILT